MTGRTFGKIGTSLWHSRRFDALPDDATRLSFIYVCTAPHSTSMGCYRLPVTYLAADRDLSKPEAREHLRHMSEAGLIEYDGDEQVILVLRWWQHYDIKGRKQLQGAINDFLRLPPSVVLPRVAAGIAVEAFNAASSFEDKARAENHAMIFEFLRRSFRDHTRLIAPLQSELEAVSDRVAADFRKIAAQSLGIELINTLSDTLSYTPPIDRDIDIEVEVDREVEVDKEVDKEVEVDGAKVAKSVAGSPPPTRKARGDNPSDVVQASTAARQAAQAARVHQSLNQSEQPSQTMRIAGADLARLVTAGLITKEERARYANLTNG